MNKVYVEVGDKDIRQYFIKKRIYSLLPFLKTKGKYLERVCNLGDWKRLSSAISKKQVCIIYEGEEFYVKLIKLPAVGKTVLDKMIRNELNNLFRAAEELVYTYEVFMRRRNCIYVLAYCINSEKNRELEKHGQKSRISGVYLIQLCIFNIIRRRTKESSFITVILYSGSLYIVASMKKRVVANTSLKDFQGNKNEFLFKLDYVLDKCRELRKEFQWEVDLKIYFVNFQYKNIIEELSKSHMCVNSGEIGIFDVIMSLK